MVLRTTIIWTAVTLPILILRTSGNRDNIPNSTIQQFNEMEYKFNSLLAKTKSEMEIKYNSLLKDQIELKRDNEVLKRSVRFLRREHTNLKRRFKKLFSDFIPKTNECNCSRTFDYGRVIHVNSLFSDEQREGDETNGGTKQYENMEKSNDNLFKPTSRVKRILLPHTMAPPTVSKALPTSRVAFYARLSHNFVYSGNDQQILFDNVITNVGSAYSAARTVFVSPVAGTYVFYSTMFTPNRQNLEIEFLLNGHTYGYNGINSYMGSNMVILTLGKHDEVSVKVENPFLGVVGDAQYGTFSGFILWPTQ